MINIPRPPARLLHFFQPRSSSVFSSDEFPCTLCRVLEFPIHCPSTNRRALVLESCIVTRMCPPFYNFELPTSILTSPPSNLPLSSPPLKPKITLSAMGAKLNSREKTVEPVSKLCSIKKVYSKRWVFAYSILHVLLKM